ncbi:hypothetical protein LCGC14_2378480 [marine sediment metagenome]|uniref:Uncharacterized protein n=1 Tax=marine sediment metagenome TaxID=412755 RepID=A0A0F9EE09_9ZZZZ
MLCKWADKVIDLSEEIPINQKTIKEIATDKYYRFDIGPDNFFSNAHPELLRLCREEYKKI